MKKIIEITPEYILNSKNDIIKQINIGENHELETKDFKLSIRPTNSTPPKNSTYIEFEKCEQLLRKINNISNSSIITFFQFETKNKDPNALINQVKYSAYDENHEELDLSLCEDIDTQIHYAIKNNSNLDLSSLSDFKSMGYDILNIKDRFYTDLCESYSDSGNDMILSDRIKFLYKNYSLCEEGCSYNDIDVENMMIACDCKIQGNISTTIKSLNSIGNEETSFLDSNIGVVKCYNLVFMFSNKSNNMGFIIFLILFIVDIVFIVIYFVKGIKPVKDYLNEEMKKKGYIEEENNNISKISNSNPIKKTLFEKKKRKKKGSSIINDPNPKKDSIKIDGLITYQEEEKKRTTRKKSLKLHKKNKSKNYKYEENPNNFGIIRIDLNNIKEYYHLDSNQSLHNYSFDEAIKYDRRNIFRIFYIYLLSKQIIFRAFLQKSPLELFYLRFTLFIFMLSCDLALNALFYFNDNISKKYQYAQNLFLFAFSSNITIIVYSTLLSYFLLTLLSKLSNSSNAIRNVFRKEEEKIQKNKKKYEISKERKKEILVEIENILKCYRIKNIILISIEMILFLFFWYFVTAFCHVYSSTQTSWLLDSFLSILSRLMLELIFGFLYAKLYQISVRSNIETFYKILLCIYDFS